MTQNSEIRRVATIVALDVAGYSARTEADEAKTTAEVMALRGFIEDVASARGGRVFTAAGDGFMLEFGSSLSAVEAAFDLAEKCEPKVRAGVHLGDVVLQPNGDLLCYNVNVATRLMARSDPGSALVSADVRHAIRVKYYRVEQRSERVGERRLASAWKSHDKYFAWHSNSCLSPASIRREFASFARFETKVLNNAGYFRAGSPMSGKGRLRSDGSRE